MYVLCALSQCIHAEICAFNGLSNSMQIQSRLTDWCNCIRSVAGTVTLNVQPSIQQYIYQCHATRQRYSRTWHNFTPNRTYMYHRRLQLNLRFINFQRIINCWFGLASSSIFFCYLVCSHPWPRSSMSVRLLIQFVIFLSFKRLLSLIHCMWSNIHLRNALVIVVLFVHPSVCLSVCYTLILFQNGHTYITWKFFKW